MEMKYYFQVAREVYDKFIEYLASKQIYHVKVKDFTPVGDWCIVETRGNFDELKKADEYLDNLLGK